MKITPVVLCGGSGTRLWPLSRKHHPKQFLKLVGDNTLFEQSIKRVIAIETEDCQIEQILIVTNENHRFLVLELLDNLKLSIPVRILLEPESKNTAPALTLAALAAQDVNPDALLFVTPADHYVKDLNQFVKVMLKAIKEAVDNVIVTIGINPTRPDTGFGYICYEGNDTIKNALSFKEKPESEFAQLMIEDGQHAWNGGMFILQSKTWLGAIHQGNNEIYQAVKKSWQKKESDHWFERPDSKLFKLAPSDSIDFAVLEKFSELGVVVKLIILVAGWSDLGSFDRLYDIEDKDQNENIFYGDVVSLNSKKSIVMSSNKSVCILGVENLIVVETADSVLVANKDNAHLIKNLTTLLHKSHKSLLDEHLRVHRPWGWYEILDKSKNFKVKRIQINPGKSISLQFHRKRSEHWIVIQGKAVVTVGQKEFELNQNESTFISKNQTHRILNKSNQILQIIEVQSGEYLGEDDIVRIHDDYGR